MTIGQRVRHIVTGLEGEIVKMRSRAEVNFLYADFRDKHFPPHNNVLIRTVECGGVWFPENELEEL